ncbi:MAG: LPXTG cell wall anchor domain-containing protein [Lachnospiraceae bacterium]|jgi:LPXTG-motif cell wall-anchored protein|nr:LPXTG cell wall anchor domain-containing protein [Lachnospiraceae bacterium]
MKNKTNKQIIKALSIGISASMMLQPMVAFADEAQEPAPATPDDHVSTVAPTVVDIQQFVDADKAIENAETKVGEAETATGIEFDNSKDEVAAATGETETVEENLQQAEANIELANENGKEVVKNQKDIETQLDEESFDQNVADANKGYADAKTAAEESKEISDKVTPNMSSSEATGLVNQATEKYNEANTALTKANEKYEAAKATYEAAVAKLAAAQEKADATAEEIKAAQDELDTAKASLDSFAQDVADAQTAAEAALAEILKDDYQTIQDAKDAVAKGEMTADAYAQLLIKSFIKANGGTFSEFSTTVKTNVTGLNEDGTNKTASTTYNTVKYTDADRKAVEDIYKVTTAEDGTVSVVKMTVEEVTDTDNVLKEAVEAKDAVAESWKTADGSKTFENTDTTHTINVSDDEKDGFYAIDTATSKDVSSDADKAVKAPETMSEGSKTVTYSAVENTENTRYEKTEYTVVDSYNTKTYTDNKTAHSKDELKNEINKYAGKNAKVEVHILGLSFMPTYAVDPDDLHWYDKTNAWLFGSGYKIKVSYEDIDYSSPKETHQEAGIYEIKTQDYTETTSITDNGHEKSGSYGFTKWTGGGKDKAKEDLKDKIDELEKQGYTITYQNVDWKWFDNKRGYFYEVRYTKTTSSNKTVTKEVSRTKYAADTYTNYTAAQDAVEAQDAVYGTKLSTTDGASLVQSDLDQKLKEQKDRKEDQEAVVQQAKDAVDAYNKAVEAVEAAQAKVDNLVEQNVTTVALSIAQAELDAAKEALETATENKEAAEEAVRDAADSLEAAQVILNTINANNQTPSGNVSTPAAPAAAAGEVLGANRKPAGDGEEEGQVLGARKSPKTGDANNALPWMGAMAGAMAGMFGVFAKKRKDEE